MPRPELKKIQSNQGSWEADTDDNFVALTERPLPLYQVADVTDLPDASEYEDCVALVGEILYSSDGTTWNTVFAGAMAPAVADSTATTVAEAVVDFNDLLASLRQGVMDAS